MSKTEIVNRALLKLGEPPVSSLNDAAFGKSYETIYEDVKNLLLSSYPWRFAVACKHLAREEELYGERYRYRLPVDCLLLLKVFGAAANRVSGARPYASQSYELAGRCIVTPLKEGVDIEYVCAVDDDAAFPPLFREALAAKTAAELAMRVKHSHTLKQALENEFLLLIRQAEQNNEIAKDAELIPDNSWILVRESWCG